MIKLLSGSSIAKIQYELKSYCQSQPLEHETRSEKCFIHENSNDASLSSLEQAVYIPKMAKDCQNPPFSLFGS